MNENDYIRIYKRDYFKLPVSMRQMNDGPMVLTVKQGHKIFVRAVIIKR